MTYDEGLAERVREVLAGLCDVRAVEERKMFGGLCFLVGGKMACGILGEELMARVGPDGYEAALRRKHAREMDFTGRTMRGFVYVSAAGVRRTRDLSGWVGQGVAYARSVKG